MDEKSVFQILSEIDISADIEAKQKIKYLPWSKAWAHLKTVYPDAKLEVHTREDGRYWFDDGKTAWVKCSLTIKDVTETEVLAVMDHRNLSIPAENVTSASASNSLHRCIVKCAALHGLGLSLWTGEELSKAAKAKKEDDLSEVKQDILEHATNKIALGVPKESIYETIQSIAGVKNPNAIKDIDIARKVLARIRKIEGKHAE